MSAKMQALNDLRQFARQFAGVMALAEELADVASVEQAADEAEQRYKRMTVTVDDWSKKLCQVEQSVAEARDEHAELIKANADLAGANGALKQEHAVLKAQTESLRAEAQTILAAAHVKAQGEVGTANGRLTELRDAIDEAEGILAMRSSELDAKMKAIREGEAKLEAINKQLADLKSRLA